MQEIVNEFANRIAVGNVEIYNEFSLQHEFGIHLRGCLTDMKIQFERNVSFFNFRGNFIKREMDLAVFSPDFERLDSAIEFKFPRNGQVPEQMFSFCKDIVFLEQLKAAGFQRAYFLAFAEDRLFYEGNAGGIYDYFRHRRPLTGEVIKPTGSKDRSIALSGNYTVEWREVCGFLKYTLIEI